MHYTRAFWNLSWIVFVCVYVYVLLLRFFKAYSSRNAFLWLLLCFFFFAVMVWLLFLIWCFLFFYSILYWFCSELRSLWCASYVATIPSLLWINNRMTISSAQFIPHISIILLASLVPPCLAIRNVQWKSLKCLYFRVTRIPKK